MRLNWHLVIPEGYKLKSALEAKRMSGVGDMFAQFSPSLEDRGLRLELHFACPRTALSYEHYSDLMGMLEAILQEAGKEVVLEKI
jgi:hypothetical protein